MKNNLGVLAFLRQDYDRAMELLLESVDQDPERAASHFNLSQTYGKKLYFEKADQELTKANRIDIERVRATMRYSEGDDRRTLLDEPLPAVRVLEGGLVLGPENARDPGMDGPVVPGFPLVVVPWWLCFCFFRDPDRGSKALSESSFLRLHQLRPPRVPAVSPPDTALRLLFSLRRRASPHPEQFLLQAGAELPHPEKAPAGVLRVLRITSWILPGVPRPAHGASPPWERSWP